MTSLNPHGRETVETVGTGETPLAYSGGFIDRAANQRSDLGFLDAALAKASTRLIPMWRDHCVVSGEPPAPVILSATEAGAGRLGREDSIDRYLLGSWLQEPT